MPKPPSSSTHPTGWIPLNPHTPPGSPPNSTLNAAKNFHNTIAKRRTVRSFSDKHIPKQVIEHILLAAGTAPSGAHKQPWRFIAISNKDTKHHIRTEVEKVERAFYDDKASNRWLDDLEPFETNPDKSYIDTVPWLIIVMALRTTDDGGQVYYLNESVGIATGLLLTAAHEAGLATLTHTPSPMKFLKEILNRPDNERPYMMIPLGYPADDCHVPNLTRKPLDQISTFIE